MEECYFQESCNLLANTKHNKAFKITVQAYLCCLIFVQVISQSLKYSITLKSSHQRCSMQKGVLRNFTKFTGKHLCQSPFFNKVASLKPAISLKMRLWHRCFPVIFTKFLRTPFYIEHLQTTASTFSKVEDYFNSLNVFTVNTYPKSGQCFPFIPLENTRISDFLVFPGSIKWEH